MTSLGLGGYDPLDARLDDAALVPPQPARRAPSAPRQRGWSASSVPVASLLLVGIALGPQGIGLFSPGALSLIDPAVPVALATLGALVGLGVDVRRTDRRALAAAVLASGVTAILVAVPLALLLPAELAATALPIWILASALGVCAASSLTVPRGNPTELRAFHVWIVELDVLLPIAAGGVLVATIPHGITTGVVGLVGQAAIIAVMLAASGWLLLARAASDTEERVFALAIMLLIGGISDYLSHSALLSGLLAGTFWQVAGGQARESLRRDALYIQHSLLVLVLVVAGARTEFSAASSAIAVVYVFLRLAARLFGGSLAGRVAGAGESRALGLYLLPPGVFGVAFALNTTRAAGPDAAMLLTIVVLGTIGSEMVARLGRPREGDPAVADPREVSP